MTHGGTSGNPQIQIEGSRNAPLQHVSLAPAKGAFMSETIYETVTSTIIAALNRGVVPWKKPWSTISSLPTNATSKKAYRGINVFLLGLMPYTDHRWLTFKQAEELGGRVKAGERSTMIVFWKQWEPPKPEDNQEEQSRKRVPILRYFRVFNVEQCEGLSIAELYVPKPLQPHERIERAEVLVRSMPSPPSIREGGNAAWYRPADDVVQIPEIGRFDSADSYHGTLFHELTHSTGHVTRLNRPAVNEKVCFGSGEYSKEELVAEMGSAFCANICGLDTTLTEGSASYIQGWLNVLKADRKAVVIAAAQAQKAADYIRGIDYNRAS
jgi:antirestriction protein ArdC